MLKQRFLLLLSVAGVSACQLMPPTGRIPQSDLIPLAIAPSTESEAFYAFSVAQLQASEDDYPGAAASLARAVAVDPETAELPLLQAEALLRAGDEAQALRVAEAALQRHPGDIELTLFLGNYHFSQNNLAEALRYFREAHALDPAHEGGALHLALAETRAGDYDRAIEILQKTWQQHPESVSAGLMLSRLYRETDRPALAEDVLLGMLKRQPELDTAYLELGSLYESRGEQHKALALYREAMASFPDLLTVRHALAQLLIQGGRLDDARTVLEALVLFAPEDLEAWRRLGLIALEQQRYQDAVTAFEMILESDPQNEQVRFYLGSAYERQEQLAAALAQFELIPPEGELYGDALTHRAYLLNKLGRSTEAIALLEGVVGTTDAPPPFYFYLASLYETAGLTVRSDEVMLRLAERFGDDADVAYRIGTYYERQGRRDAALKEMRRALALDPDHAEALNFLAYYWAEAGEELPRALEMAQRAAELKPEGHILDTLGWIWFRLGDARQARKFLEAALTKTGDDPVVLEHLGDVYASLKMTDNAAEMYRRSLDAQPDNQVVRDKLNNLVPVRKK